MTRHRAQFAPLPARAMVDLRGPIGEIEAGLKAVGLPAPPPANRFITEDGVTLVRLGPRRVLVLAALDREAALLARLGPAFAAQETADAVMVGDAHAGFALTGSDATAVLAQGAPLDLRAAAFPADMMTGTEAWGVAILLRRSGDGFEITVERSFADFLALWLATAIGQASEAKPATMAAPPRPIRIAAR